MTKVNFRTSDFDRRVANAGPLVQKNRFYETNPFLTDDGAALLVRPGLRKLTDVGAGPIRGMASEAGSFGGDLFIASYDTLWRMDNKLVKTSLYSGLFNPDRGVVNMAITAQIGDTPEYCFIADGRSLLVYVADGFAHNTLTGSAANNDVVRVGDTYYKFTTGDVDAGSPDGTSGNPWLVNKDATNAFAFQHFADALNATGEGGSDYSTNLFKNPVAQAVGNSSTVVNVEATLNGIAGNGVITTETGAGLSWADGGTMVDGGVAGIRQVQMPDDLGAIDVAVCNSFVVVIPAQVDGNIGRFYWIEPGETIVKPLNFATAERSPDGVFGVQVFGDQFWLPGESTTEVWYFTGDANFPVARLQGVVFDRGSWQNTAKAIHETMVVVDADGGVFLIQGGAPKRVSTPDIEEEIRKAMAKQANFLY